MADRKNFQDFFSPIYGDRWSSLLSALLGEETKVDRSCFEGHATYTLDPASILAAQALDVKPGDQVLDLCAAPGGKALILLEALQGKGALVANELSRDRKHRLERVIAEHAPESAQSLVTVTSFDGNQFGLKRAGVFDRVLLDAPCSSERHLLHEDPSMKEWRESRTKQLAMRQYSLICSALLSLKVGGTLVYSTCSISPLENDGVVGRLLKKKSDQAVLDLPEFKSSLTVEKTEFGFQIFPDQAQGAGPIYISRIKRI